MALKYSKQSQKAFLIVICLISAFFFFYVLSGIFSLIIYSLILAYFLSPLYNFYYLKIENKKLASIMTLGTATIGIFIPLGLLSYFLILSLIKITVQYKVYIENPQILNITLQKFFSSITNSNVLSSIDFSEIFLVFVNFVIETTKKFFSNIPITIFSFFVVLFLTYYVLANKKELLLKINLYVPMGIRKQKEILNKIEKNLQVLFKGYFLTGIVQTLIALVGYIMFGVPNILIVTFLTFIISLIPYVGTPIIWVPIGFYLVIIGKTINGIGLLIYGTFVISMIDNFIRPVLMSNEDTISPPLVFMGLIGGMIAFGVSGIILGPMIISISMILFSYLRELYIIDE